MADLLIVVDMQNDFIDGSLGTKEAVGIVSNVEAKIQSYLAENKKVIFTRDTHYSDYLSTFEGKHLPVEHCIEGTTGWEISDKLTTAGATLINKITFGYENWKTIIDPMKQEKEALSIELCGLCTDICVLSNALLLRAFYPSMDITVDSNCCAGVTVAKHDAALEVMRSCQIDVL